MQFRSQSNNCFPFRDVLLLLCVACRLNSSFCCVDPERVRQPIALAMPLGSVHFFWREKGYGFITPADGSKDVFVHRSALDKGPYAFLVPGQRVIYQVEWDYDAWNSRVRSSTGGKTGLEQLQDVDGDNTHAPYGKKRRWKHPSKLGLNETTQSQWQTSSAGARERRYWRRHPQGELEDIDVDEDDL